MLGVCHHINYTSFCSSTAKPVLLTLFSMGCFKNTTVWGGGAPNFVVSSSIMIKFGVLVEFDKFSTE